MGDEVLSFAKGIGATDLKSIFDNSKYRGLFKRRNYFLLDNDKFLIVKISRNKIRPFYGFGKDFLDLFNTLTEKNGDYYFVALESDKSGWVVAKHQIMNMISNKLLSFSEKQREYKINGYNLKNQDYFTSIDDFLGKIVGSQKSE
jgi:hypothetical protein